MIHHQGRQIDAITMTLPAILASLKNVGVVMDCP